MAAITSDPLCFELSDDGTNEPESDVSCISAAIAADHRLSSLLTQLKQAPFAAGTLYMYYKHYKIKHYINYNKR